MQPIEEIFEKLLSQVDPYEFDMHIKSKNSNLEYIYNSSHSFSSNILDVDIYNPEKNILMYGIANQFPAIGYIDEHNNKLILLSASGILAYSTSPINKLNKDLIFKQINTNIHEFINEINLRNRDNIILIGLKEVGILQKIYKYLKMTFMSPTQEKLLQIVGTQVFLKEK